MPPTHWPSAPIPNLEDASFGLTGEALRPLREAMKVYFGTNPSDVSTAGAAAAAAAAAAATGMATRGDAPTAGSKPSLFLVAGDALGARLLGWCRVACRSPQWRGLFSKGSVAAPAPPPPPQAAGKKRSAEDMDAEPSAVGDEAEGDAGGRVRDDEPPGLARLLCVVGEVVHAVKEHTKALSAARDRGRGAGFFDVKTRDTSALVQELVGALADAVFDVFRDHLDDPSLHSLLLRANSAEAACEAAPGTEALSRVVPLVDGASPSEIVGLSVELVSDLSWLFSSLEAEGAAAGLSSSVACWASGRLLACMPGRPQLEHALGVGGAAVRPLPARLACFAVRTLLEQVQLAREKDGGAAGGDAAAVPAAPSSAARACAGRSTASSRVALITEQLPAWRERQPAGGGTAANNNEEAAAAAAAAAAPGRAAATEVLDALVASLCVAAEHDRLAARPAGSQRRPTVYSAGSVGTLVGPALQALSELLGEASLASGGRGGGGTSTRSGFLTRGKKRRASTASGETGGAAGELAATAERWTHLVGQRLTSCLDRVHVAGMLLAWDSWNPWMEKATAATPAATSAAGSLRQTRNWKTYCSLTGQLAKACVSPRPPPPPGQGLAALVTRTVLSFRAVGRSASDPVPFLDMPAVLLLCKVGARRTSQDSRV